MFSPILVLTEGREYVWRTCLNMLLRIASESSSPRKGKLLTPSLCAPSNLLFHLSPNSNSFYEIILLVTWLRLESWCRDGKSRQFGFVGFRSQHEAEEALQYFNKSFMDTSRITCEVCLCCLLVSACKILYIEGFKFTVRFGERGWNGRKIKNEWRTFMIFSSVIIARHSQLGY